jgi:predicted nucleic acid-binding protein
MATRQWIFDCSVSMTWCFEDERSAKTDELFDRLVAGSKAMVPQIWPLEVGNVLTLASKKGRITPAKRRQFLSLLAAAPIQLDFLSIGSAFGDVIALAEAHGLTTYDASYLELAIREGSPLATLDKALRAAAKVVGVSLLL